MKPLLTFVGVAVFLTTTVAAEEAKSPFTKAAATSAEDCSTQVWPHFSPSCLRNVDKAVAVRLVTADRR